jgi:hypothetical protein
VPACVAALSSVAGMTFPDLLLAALSAALFVTAYRREDGSLIAPAVVLAAVVLWGHF